MDLELRCRRALVTGLTAGIGLATARLLAAEGAHVVVNGRTEERMNEAKAAVRASALDAVCDGVAVDLGTADGCARMIVEVREVDILVSNVGVFEPKPLVGTFMAQMAQARAIDAAAMEREFFEHARPSSLFRRFATPEEKLCR